MFGDPNRKTGIPVLRKCRTPHELGSSRAFRKANQQVFEDAPTRTRTLDPMIKRQTQFYQRFSNKYRVLPSISQKQGWSNVSQCCQKPPGFPVLMAAIPDDSGRHLAFLLSETDNLAVMSSIDPSQPPRRTQRGWGCCNGDHALSFIFAAAFSRLEHSRSQYRRVSSETVSPSRRQLRMRSISDFGIRTGIILEMPDSRDFVIQITPRCEVLAAPEHPVPHPCGRSLIGSALL